MVSSPARAFNAYDYLVGRARRDGRGSQDAVRGRATFTYDELDAEVVLVSTALRECLEEGERVLLVTTDGVAMMSVILGAFRSGVVAVPVSTMLTGAELGSILADSGAGLVVVSPEFAGAVSTALALSPAVRTVVTLDVAEVSAPEGVAVSTWTDFVRVFFTEPLPGRDAPLGAPGGAAKVGDLGTDTQLVVDW